MDLVVKIMNFQVVCEGDKQLFMDKLCTEYNWSENFSKKAFFEYKRFIYLAAISSYRVVPSKIVDKVWHLHLTFSKSYWTDLCGQILQRDLHHNPSLATSSYEARDLQNYQDTIDLYRQFFKSDPPYKFWPKANSKARNYELLIPVFASAVLLTACTSIGDEDAMFYVKWAIGIFAVYHILKWIRKSGGSGGGGGCSSCSSGCGGD